MTYLKEAHSGMRASYTDVDLLSGVKGIDGMFCESFVKRLLTAGQSSRSNKIIPVFQSFLLNILGDGPMS